MRKVFNFTELRDKSSQNPSNFIAVLDKSFPSLKETSILLRLGFTLRRLQGFIVKFIYPLHSGLNGGHVVIFKSQVYS